MYIDAVIIIIHDYNHGGINVTERQADLKQDLHTFYLLYSILQGDPRIPSAS